MYEPRTHQRLRALAVLSALAAAVLLAGCQSAVLDPRGPIGRAQKIIMIDSLAIMLAIVVPTIVAAIAFAWWFRASNEKAKHLPDWSFSGRIELVVWSIPLMTIILLGGVTWISAHRLDPAVPIESKQETLQVQVISLDWKWLFIYPDQQVAAVNQLVLPAGVPVRFSLTSASVMNTFFIPQLGSMIYTMNGMATTLHLQADEPGSLRGISGHFSGDGFSDMHFEVKTVAPAEFASWVASTRAAGPSLDSAAYQELAKQSIAPKPSTYKAVEKGLFDKVVSLEIAPSAGPALEQPGKQRADKSR